MKLLLNDMWKLNKEEILKINNLIKEKLNKFNIKEFWINNKRAYNFNFELNKNLGFIVNYNLGKRKKEGFKYFSRGDFLIDDFKIIAIWDFNYNLIKENAEYSILKELKGGFKL